MNKIIENTNLNINSWLVNCGLISGYLHDGNIKSTKLTIFSWLGSFCITIYTAIKWIVILFTGIDSELSNQLGDWAYFYGPRKLVDFTILILAIYVLFTFILFIFSSKHPKKMLFWLEKMEFDLMNRRFSKLILNESESKTFTWRMSLLRIIYISFVYLSFAVFVISNFYSTFKRKKAYFFHYLISVSLFCIQFLINCYFIYGFLIILYQVKNIY